MIMACTKTTFNAKFIGRQPISGPFSDTSLSDLVKKLRLSSTSPQQKEKSNQASEDFRCNLEFFDRSLIISFVKKDEGFESDGESSTLPNGERMMPNSVESRNSGIEVETVKDHVPNETSSLDETSGAESGDDCIITKSSSSSHESFSSGSSPSTSPTADLQEYKFDRKETYQIENVLICHTDKGNKNCIVWVVRKLGSGSESSLEALVFQCFSEENIKDLSRKFLDVSKRSKLENQQCRKRYGTRYQGSERLIENLKQTETHVELKDPLQEEGLNSPQDNFQRDGRLASWSLVHHTDQNGISHIEVESKKLQLKSIKDTPPIRIKKSTEKSKFARELESILSKELESRRENRGSESASPGLMAKVWGLRSTSEPQSLRQRAPALLLRKLDEFEVIANRVWGSSSTDSANENPDRKVWQKSGPSKGASKTPPPSSRRPHELTNRCNMRFENIRKDIWLQKSENWSSHDVQPKPLTNNLHSGPEINRLMVSPNLQAATSLKAPPYTQSALVPLTPSSNILSLTGPPTKKEAEKQILIPTKTGKEPVRKLYPKELPPDKTYNRVVAFPVQFASTQLYSHQPMSIPIYPLQVTPMTWSHYHHSDFSDSRVQWVSNSTTQVLSEQKLTIRGARGRSGERISCGDPHRRAQSKSPERRNDYLDNIASDMSKKLREFGDAVRQRISRKPTAQKPAKDSTDSSHLKSNLKKHRVTGSDNSLGQSGVTSGISDDSSTLTTATFSADNKKVHFNKFATVQLME